MAASTKSPLPIAVFWFVVGAIVLVVAVRFFFISLDYYNKAADSHADAAQYSTDCSASVVAQGTSDVMAVEGRRDDCDAYLLQHASDPCRFKAMPAEIHFQTNELTAMRPPGYYLDTHSDTEANFSVRLAPAATPYPLKSFMPAIIEIWHDHSTKVTGEGETYLGYYSPVSQEQQDAGAGNVRRLVAAGTLIFAFLPIALGAMYMRRLR